MPITSFSPGIHPAENTATGQYLSNAKWIRHSTGQWKQIGRSCSWHGSLVSTVLYHLGRWNFSAGKHHSFWSSLLSRLIVKNTLWFLPTSLKGISTFLVQMELREYSYFEVKNMFCQGWFLLLRRKLSEDSLLWEIPLTRPEFQVINYAWKFKERCFQTSEVLKVGLKPSEWGNLWKAAV